MLAKLRGQLTMDGATHALWSGWCKFMACVPYRGMDSQVSICVLLYIAVCAVASMAMHVTQREWDRISMKSTEQVTADLSSFLEILRTSTWQKILFYTPIVKDHFRDEADFKVVELLFKTKYHLGKDFDYVMYIKFFLEKIVVDQSTITPIYWCMISLASVMAYFVARTRAANPIEWCVWCGDNGVDDADGFSLTDHRRLGAQAEVADVCVR